MIENHMSLVVAFSIILLLLHAAGGTKFPYILYYYYINKFDIRKNVDIYVHLSDVESPRYPYSYIGVRKIGYSAVYFFLFLLFSYHIVNRIVKIMFLAEFL